MGKMDDLQTISWGDGEVRSSAIRIGGSWFGWTMYGWIERVDRETNAKRSRDDDARCGIDVRINDENSQRLTRLSMRGGETISWWWWWDVWLRQQIGMDCSWRLMGISMGITRIGSSVADAVCWISGCKMFAWTVNVGDCKKLNVDKKQVWSPKAPTLCKGSGLLRNSKTRSTPATTAFRYTSNCHPHGQRVTRWPSKPMSHHARLRWQWGSLVFISTVVWFAFHIDWYLGIVSLRVSATLHVH